MSDQPASDMEMVEFLESHIDAPCEVDVQGTTHNIREFYLRELQKLLPTILDPAAQAKAEEILRNHQWPTQ